MLSQHNASNLPKGDYSLSKERTETEKWEEKNPKQAKRDEAVTLAEILAKVQWKKKRPIKQERIGAQKQSSGNAWKRIQIRFKIKS